MTIGFVYWLLMLLWLVFGLWDWWSHRPAVPAWGPYGNNLLLFLLLGLSGWALFGPPIR